MANTSQRRAAVVTGHFDPVVAAHARRLLEIRQGFESLIVVVLDSPQPVLETQARAILLAALAAVDYVVVSSPSAALEHPSNATVFHEEATGQLQFQRFLDYVRRRHSLAVPN